MQSLLTDETNHPYVLSSFNRCINDYEFEEKSVNAIAVSLINSARTVNNVFSYFLDVCTFAITDTIN